MEIQSERQALAILNDPREEYEQRGEAARYLSEHASPTALKRLMQALQDHDFIVRWIAAEGLAKHCASALPDLLTALTEPQYAGDSRFRESVYHVLHHNQFRLHVPVSDLLKALHGPAADIATMKTASILLEQLTTHKTLIS